MKKKLILVVSLVFAVLLGGCAEYYQEKNVKGENVEKEYDKGYWKKKKVCQKDGTYKEKKKYVPQEWEIVVAYKGIEREYEFSNPKIYNNVKEGDKVDLKLIEGVDKNGKVIFERIE